jgi:hypothetical protein
MIRFPNRDKVYHNVFSISNASRFDLGLYKEGSGKSITFRKAGVVDIYCNIHPSMVAKVKVMDSPFYAQTDAKGNFRIEGVPPGTYPIVAWQPWGEEVRGTVNIAVGKTASVTLEMRAGKADTSHLRVDGTPYGDYK